MLTGGIFKRYYPEKLLLTYEERAMTGSVS